MKKSTIIVTSILAIILSVALVVGLTFSLFTSEDKIDISVKSGSVNLEAYIVDVKLYSAESDGNGNYSYTQTGDKFSNGGTVNLSDDKTVSLDNVSAGDKAELEIQLENKSNINIKYKSLLALIEQDYNQLFEVLDVSFATDGATATDGVTTAGGTVGGNRKTIASERYDDKTISTGWTELKVNEQAKMYVAIAIPVEETGAQGITAKFRCTVSAIQSTSEISGIALVNGTDCLTLQEAVHNAIDGDTIEIVRSYTNGAVGEVVIDKEISIVSSDGLQYKFSDVKFRFTEGGSLTLNGLHIYGNSYFDASNMAYGSVENCLIEVNPELYYNEGDRVYLERPAFVILSGVQNAGVALTVRNNEYIPLEGGENMAAVYVESALADGSVISGNTFGTAEKPFEGYAIEIRSVMRGGATITISDNEFYGANGVTLDQKNSNYSYKVVLSGNKMVAEAENVYLASVVSQTGVAVQLTDNGSTINGNAVSFDNFDLSGNTLFCGINVTHDDYGDITGGLFKLIGLTLSEFREAYAAPYAQNITEYTGN